MRLIDLERRPNELYLLHRALRLVRPYLAVLMISTVLPPICLAATSDAFSQSALDAVREVQTQVARRISGRMSEIISSRQGSGPEELLPRSLYTIVGQARSISLEWQFYMLLPLCPIVIHNGLAPAPSLIAMIALTQIPGLGDTFICWTWRSFGVGIATCV